MTPRGDGKPKSRAGGARKRTPWAGAQPGAHAPADGALPPRGDLHGEAVSGATSPTWLPIGLLAGTLAILTAGSLISHLHYGNPSDVGDLKAGERVMPSSSPSSARGANVVPSTLALPSLTTTTTLAMTSTMTMTATSTSTATMGRTSTAPSSAPTVPAGQDPADAPRPLLSQPGPAHGSSAPIGPAAGVATLVPARPSPVPSHHVPPQLGTRGPPRAAAPPVSSRPNEQPPVASSHAGHVSTSTTQPASPVTAGPGADDQPTAVPSEPAVTTGPGADVQPTAVPSAPAVTTGPAAIPAPPAEPPPGATHVVRVVQDDGSSPRVSIARRAVPPR